MFFSIFLCVHDAAATRGQYLALSKAGLSCLVNRISLCCHAMSDVLPVLIAVTCNAFDVHCSSSQKQTTDGRYTCIKYPRSTEAACIYSWICRYDFQLFA